MTNLVLWKSLEEIRNECISVLLTNVLLVDDWEFHREMVNNILHISFTSDKVESILGQLDSEVLILEEWVVFFKGNVNILLWASKHHYHVLSFVILLFPGIDVVE